MSTPIGSRRVIKFGFYVALVAVVAVVWLTQANLPRSGKSGRYRAVLVV
jgi:hypothetical protein